MKLLDKIYLSLFSKKMDKIISSDGHFEFNMPTGFRFRKARKMYQIFDPNDKTFLFQWSGHILKNRPENQFDIELERKKDQYKNPSTIIQKIGLYDFLCSVTTTKRENDILYTYVTGNQHKRLFITILIDGGLAQEVIDQKATFGLKLLERLKINCAK